MSFGADLHVLYKIANSPILQYPYPHIYVKDVFPDDYFRALREHLPPESALKTLTSLRRVVGEYPDSRLVLPLAPEHIGALPEPYRAFWGQLASWLLGGAFGQAILPKFMDGLKQRFGDLGRMQFFDEALLVQDSTTYSLGPHTDNPKKVLSFLFYLPADDSMARLGTSIYVPRDPEFSDDGRGHFLPDSFLRMTTMPYLPNTLFAFLKTNNSFHGVEPISDPDVRRDLLLYDIKVQNPPELARQPVAQQPAAKSAAHFTF